MKLSNIFSAACFASLVSALPAARPVPNTQFEVEHYLDKYDLTLSPQDMETVEQFSKLNKRAGLGDLLSESTISSLLKSANQSGLVFKLLDQFAGHPDRISKLANITGNLIKGSSNSSSSSSSISLSTVTKFVNISQLLETVQKSGLIGSVLDGVLLDEDYRPVLVNLTYRVVESNKGLIALVIDDLFKSSPSGNQKRADHSGSLTGFVSNFVLSFLGSPLFNGVLSDTLNALNDTGVAVYTIKRVIANESYQNMTADFVSDLYDTGAIDLSSLGDVNISKIVSGLLGDTSAIQGLLGGVLSGNSIGALTSAYGKYAPALQAIVKDLEAKGLFEDLNNYIFPSSSSSASPTSSASAKKKVQMIKAASTSKNSSVSTTSSSSHGAGTALSRGATTPVVKMLVFVQSLFFGGALLLV